jgi:hypothetical protein
LEEWNKRFAGFKLHANSAKKDELLFTFTLPASVPIQSLWPFAFGISTDFIAALNIATGGFFWWYVPRQTGRFYDEIRDLETNSICHIERSPRLEIGWPHARLKGQNLGLTNITWGYLLSITGKKEEEPLKSYVLGLTMLSKIDLHFQIEPNAFLEFFKCFKGILLINGDWDGAGNLQRATQRALGNEEEEIEGLANYIQMGHAIEENKQSTPITLKEVIGMKSFCDLMFLRLAVSLFESKRSVRDTR